jgi:nucleoside-diphosphate-sugar epimerase
MINFTILGSDGWIGNSLTNYLSENKYEVFPVGRNSTLTWLKSLKKPTKIIYTIGVTADYRTRPYDTVEAHVCLLSKILQHPLVTDLVYLSSTRVYSNSLLTNEDVDTVCNSNKILDLYNISKLMGESLVLQKKNTGCKVIRLSNVVGPAQPDETFIGSLLRENKKTGKITINQAAESSKDYIHIDDVNCLITKISLSGKERIYNLASGKNITHKEVANWLKELGASISFANEASEFLNFSKIDVQRISNEFYSPASPFNHNKIIAL